MVQEHIVKGYEAFKSFLESSNVSKETVINVLFTGEKVDGVSWCPDCVESEPFIKEAVAKYAPENSIFLTVDVGGRDFWKDQKNPFRTDLSIGKVQVIPTILKLGTPKRLEGNSQCAKPDLLQMFFEDDD